MSDERIEAQNIVLKHPSGSGEILLSALEGGGVGIWLKNVKGSHGNMVAIYSLDGQTAVGIYGRDCSRGMAAALSVDANGSGFLQLIKADGTAVVLSAETLERIK